MNRLSFAFVAGLSLVACGPKEFGSVCSEVPPPAACMTACDPSPGAANACPVGYHCSGDGNCDAQCTASGGQCGDGYRCTDDGYCVDDSGPGSNGPDASCPAINFTPMPVTPSIQLVLDRSGSMSTNLSGNTSRYQAMRDALVKNMTGVVTQLETKAYFGSELYTCANGAVDLKKVPRALSNASMIQISLDGTGPGDNTPTPEAITAAVADFAASPPPAGSPPIIVLATDGLPNSCANGNSDTRNQSVAAAAAAFAAGIPVYVLAINSADQHFQNLANAGQGATAGTNVPYYPVNSAAALSMAFQTIINGVISCDLKLTSSIDDNSAMNGTVMVNGQTLTYGTDWTLVNGNIIRLTGGACNTLKASANPTVSATFPCGSVIF